MYLISMVAETLDMHPQTLRKYERAGFIAPLRMGTLRTYSDEDVARLRLIKHFVEDLGLNLAGVELALSITGDLLKLRTGLIGMSVYSEEIGDSISQIDAMLARMGIRVMKRVESGSGDLQDRRDGWFGTAEGESLEFGEPAQEAQKDAGESYA